MSGIHLQLATANMAIDIALPAHGISVIIGASGAGKTTLLRAVAGLEPTARGRVEINGQLWQDDAQKLRLPTYQRSVGMVFQEASLFGHLSVRANLEFGLQRIPLSQQTVSLPQVIALLGIAPLLTRTPASLSGGEKQRVAIARALATSPQVLLMDEPLASLDEARKAEILPYLEQLPTALNMPIIYVSHALDEVARLADEVVLLDAGKVRAQGSAMDLLSRTDLPFAHGDAAFSLIVARVIQHDSHYHLTQLDFEGGTIWLPQSAALAGATAVRLRIQARDVSLTLQPQQGSSILNTLAVTISSICSDSPGLCMLELHAGGTRLLARITQKSLDQLQLMVGMAVYAQIKGVALLK